MTWFGYPKRVLADSQAPRTQRQGSKSVLTQVPKPIPALSYTEEAFFEETALWYDAICAILARHAHPNGGIVAAQVDNEMAFFFGINAYSGDYSTSSLAAYRRFVTGKHRSLDGVNAAYGTSWATVEEIDPPRRFDATKTHVPYYADWAEYRERYLVGSMERLAGMMRERGLDKIALFHNYPHPLGPGGAASGFTTPFNIPAGGEARLGRLRRLLAQAPLLARQDGDVVRRGYQPLSLHPRVHRRRMAVVPQPRRGLRRGVRHQGRAHARDQGIQPLHAGRARPLAGLSDPVGRARTRQGTDAGQREPDAVGDGRFARLQRESDVLLLANREYDRLEAASVLVSFLGDFLECAQHLLRVPEPHDGGRGVARVPAHDPGRQGRLVHGLLRRPVRERLRVRPVRHRAVARAMGRIRAVLLATFDYLDSDTQKALVDYAAGGGVLVIGPEAPWLDSLNAPPRRRHDRRARRGYVDTGPRRPLGLGGNPVGSSSLTTVSRCPRR